MVKKKDLVVAVLITFCLTACLFLVRFTRSQTLGQYDPWLDITDDGKIDVEDVARVARAFGTHGTSISKASIDYDSGWVNITDKCGKNIVITHNLNSTNPIVDIQGRTTTDGGIHQKYLGLTGYEPGWSRTYGGGSQEAAYSLIQTSDGGYALAGGTFSPPWVFWLIKTDVTGNVQWSMTYGRDGGAVCRSVVQTRDGGYALAGDTYSYSSNSWDFWLVKTDSFGNMQWNMTYGGTLDEAAHSIVQTSDGGYALAGCTNSFGAGSSDFWLVKTDSTGNMQWSRTYGGTNDDYAMSMVQTDDGNFTIGGYTYSFGAGVADAWLVKTYSDGNMQWNRTYGGTGFESTNSMVKTSDEGYALAGIADNVAWLVKTYSDGNMQWNRTYGQTYRIDTGSLVQTKDGGYALVYSGEIVSSPDDFSFVKTDAVGNMQWNATYGGAGQDSPYSVVQTADGGYAIFGITDSFGTVGDYVFDFWLVKTNVESGLAWTNSTTNTLTLYRGATDPYWNFVRVRLWKPR